MKSMLRNIFKSDSLNAQFHELGFVRLPLLNKQEVGELRSFFDAKHEESGDRGFFTTIWLENMNLRNEVNDYIISILYDEVAELLVDYTPVFANYMVKKPCKKSITQYHWDWTYVDESKFRAIKALKWIARSNGVTVYSDPGDAVIWNHRVFYSSSATITERRISFDYVLSPADAVTIHYAMIGKRKTNSYEVDDDFLNRSEIGKMPQTGKLVETLKMPHRDINQPQINMIIDQ
ncbi:MAG: hypothetical protein GY751_17350 [Bacteroidetes bacterium]|nr:hypothetical protein [Bacteroidota bacterium]